MHEIKPACESIEPKQGSLVIAPEAHESRRKNGNPFASAIDSRRATGLQFASVCGQDFRLGAFLFSSFNPDRFFPEVGP
jgi:hypothetical protein